jgi:hypothetical protein
MLCEAHFQLFPSSEIAERHKSQNKKLKFNEVYFFCESVKETANQYFFYGCPQSRVSI